MLPRCIFGLLAMARLCLDAFPSVYPWQYSATVRSRAAIRDNFCAPCIPKVASDGKRGASWQDSRAMHPKRAGFGKMCAPCIRKAPQIAVGGYTARRSCQEGTLFAARAPRIMHGAQIMSFLGAPFERFDLFRVGWGGARGSRTALALYGAVLMFRALSPFVRGGAAVSWVRSHAASSCSPLTRKMLLLSRLPSRETCPLLPCEVCVHSVSSHAGQAHSPRVAGYIPPRRPRAFCPARPFCGGARC